MSNTNLTADQLSAQIDQGGIPMRGVSSNNLNTAMLSMMQQGRGGIIIDNRLQQAQAQPIHLQQNFGIPVQQGQTPPPTFIPNQPEFNQVQAQTPQPTTFIQPQLTQQPAAQELRPDMINQRVGKIQDRDGAVVDSRDIQRREVPRQQTRFTPTHSRQVTSSNTNYRQSPKQGNEKPEGLVETFYKKVNITSSSKKGISLHRFEQIAQGLLNTSGKEVA